MCSSPQGVFVNGWRLDFETSDGKDETVFLVLPHDTYKTALAVQIAAEKGKFPEVKLKPGAIVLVQEDHSNTMGA